MHYTFQGQARDVNISVGGELPNTVWLCMQKGKHAPNRHKNAGEKKQHCTTLKASFVNGSRANKMCLEIQSTLVTVYKQKTTKRKKFGKSSIVRPIIHARSFVAFSQQHEAHRGRTIRYVHNTHAERYPLTVTGNKAKVTVNERVVALLLLVRFGSFACVVFHAFVSKEQKLGVAHQSQHQETKTTKNNIKTG